MELKGDYNGLLDLLVDRRAAVERFLAWLERETAWLAAPASTTHHLNVPGGLVQHSVQVTQFLLGIRARLEPAYRDESCVIVGLFHDVGKVGAPGKPYYGVVRESSGELVYRVNPELVTMGVAVRSLYLISPHIDLSDEEAQAICYHDGQYIPDNQVVKNRECPLTLLLHFADLWSSHVREQVAPADKLHHLLETAG